MGLLLLGAAAAEAQTPRILVSNSAVADDDVANTSGNDHAQLFHTGGHTDGYILTSVHVNSDDAENDDFDVEICEADGTANDFPTTTCTALTAPDSFTIQSLAEFKSAAGLALSANTNYVVVIKQRGTGSVRLKSTTNTGEDTSIGLSDWSIKNKFYWKSGSTWMIKSGTNEALRIIVNGYERAAAPTVLTVSKVSADGTYNLGETISLNVVFNAAVTVTGTPQLALEIGADTTPRADYASGSGTQTLQFDYEVVAGDEDTDGIGVPEDALTLNGGTISAGGTPANVTLGSASFSGILVDGGPAVVVPAPTVSGVALTEVPNNNTWAIGDEIEATVTFSAAVDITGTPQLELDFDGTPKAAACDAATNTTTMVCFYTVAVGDSAPDGIAIAANKLTLNGGTITATGSTTVNADLDHGAVAIDAGQKVDGSRPTLVTTGSEAPTTSTDGTQVILTFSEDISAADRTKITIGIGGGNVAVTSAARVAGTTVELDLSTIIDATVMLTVALDAEAVEDAAANGNLPVPATAVINAIGSTTAPTVTAVELISTPNDNVYAIDDTVVVAVRFSAAVDITGTPQLELDFDGTPKPAACLPDTNTTGMACNYTVVMGDSAPNGIAIAANTLTLNGGTIRAAGSTTVNAVLALAAVAIDANHKVDGIRPTLVTTGSEAPTTSTDGTTVILTFSEDIEFVNRSLISILANGATQSTTADSRAGNKVELTLATALTATATNLTVALATNSVFDAAGNSISLVLATGVTNAVGAPDPPGTLKARRGDGEVHLEWVPVAAVPTDPDRAYQLRYGAAGGESNQWRDIPGSAPGGPHARSYTVTGLENGTRYAFELRVRRGSGVGTATEIRQTPEAARWSVSTNRRSVHEGEDVTLSIATSNAVGFYSAPEVLTLAVMGQIVLEFATIKGADPEDFEIRVDGTTVQGYTKDITLLNFDKDLAIDPFPAQHFDVEVPVGSTSLDVTVTVLADEEEDGQEHMSFMVFRGEELVNEDTWEETGVNIESRDAGVVKQLAVADAEATEGEDPSLDFVVTLAPAAAWTVTVDYATHAGTARAGSDYTHTSGALTFAPGETAKTVSVPVIDDTVEDTPETLTVRLSDANPPYNEEEGAWEWGSQEAGVLIADAVATGTIRNTEDPAEPRAVDLWADFPESAFTSTRHTGSDDRLQVVVAFSEAVAEFAANTPSVSVTGASGVSVQTHTEDGLENAYVFFMTPDGDGDVTFALTTNAACAAGGICTADGTVLTQVPAAWTIPGPEAAADDDADDDTDDDDTAPASLTAAFGEVPAEHDGQSAFNVRVEFSEDVGISYKALRDESFSVTDGDVTGARRVDGRHDLWEITVEPDSREAVTISLPGGSACGTAGAVCTRGDDPRPLSNSPSARVAGPADDAPEPNTAAAGAPTISGTPQVGEALTVSTSGISDADGLDNARFAYQWIRTGADIQGATGSTYTPVAADQGQRLKVRVRFTDDAGHEERLTSAATDAVAAPPAPAPLTARFSDVPTEHTGEAFTFGLTFSEDVAGLSFKTLRDQAFTVTGGAVLKAQRRQQGSNEGWTITVDPDSHAAVTIRLPAGAVETSDGRGLESAVSATVAGPVGISVADARVEEGAGAMLEFAVTLSRAAAGQVTVDYQTVNGTASAGTDYTAANGTLTFAAGESSQTVEVAVLDDSHDEGEETMTLRLSNPSEGRLADAEATGTIENTDPLPRALLARFGRATALHVMEQVEERLEASRDPGFRGRFAGRELRRGMERDMGRNFLSRLESTAGAGARDTMGGQSDLSPTELLRTGLGGGDVLMGSGFVLNRETGGGASVSLWSRGMESRFSGRDGELSLDGGVRTTMFGADYAKGPLMAGLMLSHRRGLGGYQGADIGQVASSVTGLHPWVGYQLTERVTLWGVTGYGRGSLSLTPGEALSLPTSLAAPVALEGGLSMSMLAGGVRGDLVDAGIGGFGLAFKADALWVGTGSEAVDDPAGRLAGTEAVVTRVRTALEASRGYVFGHGIALQPSFEVGLRRDGGDAETGAGADVAASLIAADPLTGLSVDVRVRTLLVHQDEGFRERGVSVSFSYDPTPQTPLGLTARVAPSWGGQAMSGADALWGRDTMEGLGAAGPGSGDRIDAEFGYALPVGSRLVGTPRFGVTTSEYGRGYRLGYGLAVVQGGAMSFQFSLDAQRRESLGRGDADHSLVGRLTVGW